MTRVIAGFVTGTSLTYAVMILEPHESVGRRLAATLLIIVAMFAVTYPARRAGR